MPKFRSTPWRLLRVLLVLIVSLSFIFTYFFLKSRPSYSLYNALDRLELEHSTNYINQTKPESKYVLFTQLRGAGFNNQVQEILLYHHLALSADRTYVYQPLVWRSRGPESLVPLSAFLRGPTTDAINVAAFNSVCPPKDVTRVKLLDQVSSHRDLWGHALSVLRRPDRCIAIDDWILNWNYLESDAIHAIWPSFRKYLFEHFLWSNQVLDISKRAHEHLKLRANFRKIDGDPYIAIHLRRGDFEDHCRYLAKEHKGFTTWANLRILTNSIFPPRLDSTNETSMFLHCYPEMSRILALIDMHAKAKPHLRTIHILHDGAWDHPLVYYQQYRLERELKDARRAGAAGWPNGPMKRVTHSGQLPWKWGEVDWTVSVDVELARNAEVFIGNGFSSLSSQVIALRLGVDFGRAEDISLF